MGKLGRLVVITLPVVFTIATLVCLILIALAQGKGMMGMMGSSLWYIRVKSPTFSQGMGIFEVYLWNYCSGNEQANFKYCSPRQNGFQFDPAKVLGFHPVMNPEFDNAMATAVDTYRKLAKIAFGVLIAAEGATVLEIVLAILALYSRWGSFLTWIVAAISSVCVTLWAILVSVMFTTLAGALNAHFVTSKDMHASLGGPAFAVTWLAAAFSIAAAGLWFFSICCFSGKSRGDKEQQPRRTGTFGAARGYAQVPEPFTMQEKLAGSTAYLRPYDDDVDERTGRRAEAYEPFRHAGARSASADPPTTGYRSRGASADPGARHARVASEARYDSGPRDSTDKLAYDGA